MSHALIRGMFAVIDRSAWDGLDDHFAPDVVYDRPGYPPIEGLPALRHFYENVRIIGAGKHEIWGIVVEGDRAVCWGRFIGVSRGGSPLDERFADIYRIADGRVASRATHFFRAAI